MAVLTAYDWLLARRTLSLGVALAALAFALMVGTDDATGSLAGRLGRFAALVAIAGSTGAFLAIEQARSRGEMRALGALGVSPLKASVGAIVGGVAIGAVGPVLALSRRVDLAPLFPRVTTSSTGWVARGDGWFDGARGLFVRATGELVKVAPEGTSALVEPGFPRGATAFAFFLAAIALPLWATARSSARRRWPVALAAVATSVFAFHLVAVHRVSGAALAVPPALVLLDAAALHWRASWR